MKKIIIAILFLCVLLVSFFYLKKNVFTPKPMTLNANSIFLGQVYPSGHVYFKSSKEGLKNWPSSVYLLGMAINGNVPVGLKAQYVNTLDSAQNEDGSTAPMAIPYLEQMDDNHQDCGLGKVEKNPKYTYLGAEKETDEIDLFETVFDYCVPPADTAIYRADLKEKYSYLTLGLTEDLKPGSVRWLNRANKKLSPQDQARVAKQKEEAKSYFEKENIECTTVPAYLDDALDLYEIRFHDSAVSMLLSSYQDPGCAGHLTYVYILDVSQEGKFLKRYKFTNYFGGI